IALTSGSQGMRLFLNGQLVGTDAYTGSFASITNGDHNWVGRDLNNDKNWSASVGQVAEFRVWRVQRTADQIRGNMSRRLTGNEPGLFGLWNFDDPANPGRDASPGAHHGKLIGEATVTNATLPVVVFGNVADAVGQPLSKATIQI